MLGDLASRQRECARADSFASDCSCRWNTFLLKASDFLQMVGFCLTSDMRAVSRCRLSFSKFTCYLLAAEYKRLDTASAFSLECFIGASCEKTIDSLAWLKFPMSRYIGLFSRLFINNGPFALWKSFGSLNSECSEVLLQELCEIWSWKRRCLCLSIKSWLIFGSPMF